MPEEVNEEIQFELGLDDMVLSTFKEGRVLKNWDFEQDEEDATHYKIMHLREMMKEIYEVYSAKKKPTKKDFANVMTKRRKKMDDDIQNFIDQLDREEDLFLVKRREVHKNGNITIKLEKVDQKKKIELIKSITKKVVSKLTKEQITSIVEEGVRRNNDVKKLEEIDDALDKEDPEIEGKKGCYKLVVDGKDLFVVG